MVFFFSLARKFVTKKSTSFSYLNELMEGRIPKGLCFLEALQKSQFVSLFLFSLQFISVLKCGSLRFWVKMTIAFKLVYMKNRNLEV